MAIASVQTYLNGAWYTLTYNSSTGKYEGTLTAPGTTSWGQANHVYAMQIKATNTAGTITTVDTTDPAVGDSLKLRVLETVKPTISITSPGSGSRVTNNKQTIVFQLRDESGGSGIDISTLALKIDGGTAIGNGAAGMVCTPVTSGYDCTYTPQSALSDGSHTVTIDIKDNDGNSATQVIRTYTVDTVAPTLNITNPPDGFITNNASLVVQGTTNDITSSPVTVTIKLNNADQGPVTVIDGSFSKTLTLADGLNTIVVRSTDAAGKYAEIALTGTLDTSVPVISSVSIMPNPADTGQTMVITVEVVG